MRLFLLWTKGIGGAATGEKVLGRLEGEKGGVWIGVRSAGSSLLPLLMVMIVVVGLRSAAALRDIPKGNCTFHIFARENGLVFPIHKDLDIGWHGEEGEA